MLEPGSVWPLVFENQLTFQSQLYNDALFDMQKGYSALMKADGIDIVMELVKAGANLDLQNNMVQPN